MDGYVTALLQNFVGTNNDGVMGAVPPRQIHAMVISIHGILFAHPEIRHHEEHHMHRGQ